MIAKLRTLSPAGDRHVSHRPARAISPRLASVIALGCFPTAVFPVDIREADLRPERREGPQRITSELRSPALASQRMTGTGSVGATFQLGAIFGVGRCGGMEKTSLIR